MNPMVKAARATCGPIKVRAGAQASKVFLLSTSFEGFMPLTPGSIHIFLEILYLKPFLGFCRSPAAGFWTFFAQASSGDGSSWKNPHGRGLRIFGSPKVIKRKQSPGQVVDPLAHEPPKYFFPRLVDACHGANFSVTVPIACGKLPTTQRPIPQPTIRSRPNRQNQRRLVGNPLAGKEPTDAVRHGPKSLTRTCLKPIEPHDQARRHGDLWRLGKWNFVKYDGPRTLKDRHHPPA